MRLEELFTFYWTSLEEGEGGRGRGREQAGEATGDVCQEKCHQISSSSKIYGYQVLIKSNYAMSRKYINCLYPVHCTVHHPNHSPSFLPPNRGS
jgi:hypothetical protein